jgi:hypothetical protein
MYKPFAKYANLATFTKCFDLERSARSLIDIRANALHTHPNPTGLLLILQGYLAH